VKKIQNTRFKNTLTTFRKRPVFTKIYWQQKLHTLKNYSWKQRGRADAVYLLKLGGKIALFFVAAFILFYISVYAGLFGRIPSQSQLKALQNSTASEVYSADSVLLGRYFIQDRTNVPYSRIAPDAINALVATEDARFYSHNGVDSRSMFRVLFKSLILGNESSGGGSTISQQLAKNLFPRRRYRFLSTPINKFKEIITARRLEEVYSKKEILELYLNTVPMGENIFGIERAADRFFSKQASNLKPEEGAVLIGMLKATTSYNPRLYPDRSRQRRNVVLQQMVKYGYLPQSKADSLKNLPLTIKYSFKDHNDGLAPYFREQLRQELARWCENTRKENGQSYNLYTDGLKIYTSIHSVMQAEAEKAVARRMAALQKVFNAHWKGRNPWQGDEQVIQNAMRQSKRYKMLMEEGLSEEEIRENFEKPIPMRLFNWGKPIRKTMSPLDSIRYYQKFLNTGLISIEPGSGLVRAWIGGISHEEFQYDHVRSKRQVGSTFKPIVYAAALEKGIGPCDFFPNQQVTYAQYENWSPRNADGQYGGEYSMRGALANSVNTVSAQLIMETGIEPTIQLAQRMGIKSDLPKVPALALGAANISLLEMVSAYATIANGGKSVEPVYILQINDRQGKTIRKYKPADPVEAFSEETALLVTKLMQAVVNEGSAARIRSQFGLTMDIAGKTGTTQDQTDGWFIGFTPKLVTGVWVGGEHPSVRFRTLSLGGGAATALPVWADYMKAVSQKKVYKSNGPDRFPVLPVELEERLSCEAYIEDSSTEETFVDRLLDNILNVRDRSEEDKKRAEEERIAREQRKHEEKVTKEQKKEERKKRREERKRKRQSKDN
jgi:penicillin-binding protein 1A